jgi:hypothetical protein
MILKIILKYMTIYHVKIIYSFFIAFFNNNFFSKSKKGNRFWTFLKMSIFGNWKYFLEKGLFSGACDHNALKIKKSKNNSL